MSLFKKATKTKLKLRAAFYGPSGAGKTYSALRVARGIGGNIAVICTEHGSARKYADRFDFDVADMKTGSIDEVCAALKEAAGSFDVVIIDSLSHAWKELLEEVDRIASAKFGGNTWAAWSKGTPKQRGLVDAILTFPGHVIVTMRAKTEWLTTKNQRGKDEMKRVGLSPEQGKGIEYEFDLLVSISTDHTAFVEKDRTSKFQDQTFKVLDEDFGAQLASWLDEGADPPPPPEKPRINMDAFIASLWDATDAAHRMRLVDRAREARRFTDEDNAATEQALNDIAASEEEAENYNSSLGSEAAEVEA